MGNAPTALLKIAQLLEEGARPTLVIGVPVGFVNVVESKERLLNTCRQCGVPTIVALGRKGGSTVAAAICNALLYAAEDPGPPGPGMVTGHRLVLRKSGRGRPPRPEHRKLPAAQTARRAVLCKRNFYLFL